MNNVILISGKAEAGKTTTANILKDSLAARGYRVAIVPYGDYVKSTAKTLFGWDGKKDEAGRSLLQHWGTDIVRKRSPMFWINTVIKLCAVAEKEFDYFIIDDCRFPDEITAWTHCPFSNELTVRVERPGYENHLTPEQQNHISETALDNWKFDVMLSATNVAELWFQVQDKLLPHILK